MRIHMADSKSTLNVSTDEAIIISSDELQELEDKLGVPEGFLESLRSEDDWSFVIKSHALIEAALTTLLASHFGRPELREFIEYLETSNIRTGKVALLSNQKILTKNQITFIRKFSELRNDIVHDVKNVDFRFETYLRELSKQKFKSVTNWVIYYRVNFEFNRKVSNRAEAMRKFPKFMVWLGLLEVLSRITIQLKLLEKANA